MLYFLRAMAYEYARQRQSLLFFLYSKDVPLAFGVAALSESIVFGVWNIDLVTSPWYKGRGLSPLLCGGTTVRGTAPSLGEGIGLSLGGNAVFPERRLPSLEKKVLSLPERPLPLWGNAASPEKRLPSREKDGLSLGGRPLPLGGSAASPEGSRPSLTGRDPSFRGCGLSLEEPAG